jgi:hypothetical protein
MHFIKEWWDEAIPKNGKSNKVMALLVMLVSCKIWKERNVYVFRNHASNSTLLSLNGWSQMDQEARKTEHRSQPEELPPIHITLR